MASALFGMAHCQIPHGHYRCVRIHYCCSEVHQDGNSLPRETDRRQAPESLAKSVILLDQMLFEVFGVLLRQN